MACKGFWGACSGRQRLQYMAVQSGAVQGHAMRGSRAERGSMTQHDTSCRRTALHHTAQCGTVQPDTCFSNWLALGSSLHQQRTGKSCCPQYTPAHFTASCLLLLPTPAALSHAVLGPLAPTRSQQRLGSLQKQAQRSSCRTQSTRWGPRIGVVMQAQCVTQCC
jgi:hypothetical protein